MISCDHVIKGHVIGSSLPKVNTLPSLTVIGLVEWRYNVSNLSGYISWQNYQMDLWLCKWEPTSQVTNVPSLKFAGRRRGNITRFLYYHLIPCDHVIKETFNFVSGGPVTTAKFNVYRSHGSEDKTFPRCLVTLFGNVIKCHLWEEASEPKLPKCQVAF